MRVSLKFAVGTLVVSLAMSAFSLSVAGPTSAESPRRFVVLASGNELPVGFESLISATGGEVVARIDEIGAAIVESQDPNFLDAAGALPGLAVAEDVAIQVAPSDPDQLVLEGEEGIALEGVSPASAKFFPFQWNLRSVGAPQAWTLGFRGNPAVKVAVIDTGIDYRHQEFMRSSTVSKVSPTLSKSFYPEPMPLGVPAYMDLQGHGSHVAGIIAASGKSIAGIAPDVTLIAVKVAGKSGFATLGTIAQAIVYSANAGADVINMSFGTDEGLSKDDLKADHLRQTLLRAVNYAHSKGALLVASAGNNDINWDSKAYRQLTKVPAQLPHVAGVSATGPFYGEDYDHMGVVPSNGTFVQYSDYGKSIVVFAAPGGSMTPFPAIYPGLPPAPGDAIISVCSRARTGCGSGKAGTFMIGTSMAAAHVSGVAALIDSAFGGSLTGDQIMAYLKLGAEDFGKPGFDELYGYGRINAYRSLILIMNK